MCDWGNQLPADDILIAAAQLLNWHYMNFEMRAKTTMHLFTLKVRYPYHIFQ
jgi:hypothetical protein